MKHLFIFAILACICMVRSAPPSPSHQLIVKDLDEEMEVTAADDENEEEDTTTTTTTTTTRRTPRPSRRTTSTLPTTRRRTRFSTTTTARTINVDDVMDEMENSDSYNGDFRYFKNIRELIKKLLEDLKKFLQNLNIADIIKMIQGIFNRNQEE